MESDLPPQPCFARLAPVGDDYAVQPIRDAFDWGAIADAGSSGEWYLVVFRSVRRADADEVVLTAHDERAHREAQSSSGFIHYLKGPLTSERACLSFCLWSSRPAAREASARPSHRAAVRLVAEMYERYVLEFYRVTKRAGEAAFRFEPYDTPALAA